MMITLQMRMIDDAELYAVEIGQSRLDSMRIAGGEEGLATTRARV